MIKLRQLLENIIPEQDIEGYTTPERYKKGQYFENGDEKRILGKRVWIHTNRRHRNDKVNGIIGIYNSTDKGSRKKPIIGYTNQIRLVDNIVFSVTPTGVNRINKTGKRTLVAGISGIVGNVNKGSTSGMEEIAFDPFAKHIKGFHKVGGDVEGGQEILSADEVYIEASSYDSKGDVRWKIYAKNLKFKEQ